MKNKQLHSLTEIHVSVIGSVKFTRYNSCATLCNDIAIYKTTLFKSAKEEACVTVLQKTNGLKCNDDFLAKGYLPENIKVTKTLNLGITFKENCIDVLNAQAGNVVNLSHSYSSEVSIFNNWANLEEVVHENNLESENQLAETKIDAIILIQYTTNF